MKKSNLEVDKVVNTVKPVKVTKTVKPAKKVSIKVEPTINKVVTEEVTSSNTEVTEKVPTCTDATKDVVKTDCVDKVDINILIKSKRKGKKTIFSNRKRQYGRNIFKISYDDYLKKHKLNELNDTTSDFMLTDLEFEEYSKFSKFEVDTNYGFMVGDIVKIKSYYLSGHHREFKKFEMEILSLDNDHIPGLVYFKIDMSKLKKKIKKKLDLTIEMYQDDFKFVNDDALFNFNNCILSSCILVKSII